MDFMEGVPDFRVVGESSAAVEIHLRSKIFEHNSPSGSRKTQSI